MLRPLAAMNSALIRISLEMAITERITVITTAITSTRKNPSGKNCSTSVFEVAEKRVEKYLERVEGVEPSSLAWEARVMPLYDTRDFSWCCCVGARFC